MFASAKHLSFSIIHKQIFVQCTQGIMGNISYSIIYLFVVVFLFFVFFFFYSSCLHVLSFVYVFISIQYCRSSFYAHRFIYLNCFCFFVSQILCKVYAIFRCFQFFFLCCPVLCSVLRYAPGSVIPSQIGNAV